MIPSLQEQLPSRPPPKKKSKMAPEKRKNKKLNVDATADAYSLLSSASLSYSTPPVACDEDVDT